MRLTKSWLVLALLALSVVAANGQGDPNDPRVRGRHRPPPDQQGLGIMLTPRLLNNVIDRMTEGMVGHYGLDDDQLEQTRQVIKSRFPAWLYENQAQLQPLINEYMEALSGEAPPTPDQVASWAQRAAPLVEQVRGLMKDATDEMRNFLTDEQQVILDGEMAVFDVGVNNLQQRLQVWGQGGYDWETEWPRSAEFRAHQQAREDQLRKDAEAAKGEAISNALGGEAQAPTETAANVEKGGAAAAPAAGAADAGSPKAEGAKGDQPQPKPAPQSSRAKPTDEWTQYVENFIKRYQLDEPQTNTAYKILRSLQEQRNKYLERRLPEIESVEKRQKAAKTPEEQEKAKADFARINEPIDRYFKQLKDRLEQIPNRRQRAEAARQEMDAQAKAAEKGNKK